MRESAIEVGELRNSLAKTIADRTQFDGDHETSIKRLSFCRRSSINAPAVRVYEPSICVIVQGSKRIIVGDNVHDYEESQYLLTAIDLPTVTSVSRASPQHPCMGLMLKLDLRVISQLLVDFNLPDAKADFPKNSMSIGTATRQLLDAMRRLIDLLDDSQHCAVLLPLIEKEILYLLLIGEHGNRLRQLAMTGSKTHQIAKAADWIRANYATPLCVSQLAKGVNMSISSFHHHFRVVTSMSPLQYQKQLRLHEARRLMLTETIEAAAAALNVGYESHTQFSREYKRLFGAPPLRDIARLREFGQPPQLAGLVNGRRQPNREAIAHTTANSDGHGRVLTTRQASAIRFSDLNIGAHWDIARFWNSKYSEEIMAGG